MLVVHLKSFSIVNRAFEVLAHHSLLTVKQCGICSLKSQDIK